MFRFLQIKAKNIIAVTGTNGKTSVADLFYQILVLNNVPEPLKKNMLFSSITDSKFRAPIVPGDQVILTTTAKANRQSLWVLEGKAHVEGKLVAQAEIKLMLQPVFAENSTDV